MLLLDAYLKAAEQRNPQPRHWATSPRAIRPTRVIEGLIRLRPRALPLVRRTVGLVLICHVLAAVRVRVPMTMAPKVTRYIEHCAARADPYGCVEVAGVVEEPGFLGLLDHRPRPDRVQPARQDRAAARGIDDEIASMCSPSAVCTPATCGMPGMSEGPVSNSATVTPRRTAATFSATLATARSTTGRRPVRVWNRSSPGSAAMSAIGGGSRVQQVVGQTIRFGQGVPHRRELGLEYRPSARDAASVGPRNCATP